MKLLNEYEMSSWAYKECAKGNDTKEIRELITNNGWIYNYCKDIEEMWSKITDPSWAYLYCRDIKNRFEVGNI